MDTIDEIDKWQKAGEQLRTQLLQRRAAALAELAQADAGLLRLDAVFGRPATELATGQGKRLDELTALKPWFSLLEPKSREVVELRAGGLSSDAIAKRLGCEKKHTQNLFYRAKMILRQARESNTLPAADAPPAADAEDPEPPEEALATRSPPATVSTARKPVAAHEVRHVARRRAKSTEPDENAEPTEPTAPKQNIDAGLNAFFRDIKRHAVLTREEEAEVFRRWKETGDRRFADQLVAANLRIVVAIAHPYSRIKRHSILDLIQEGSIGLVHALSKFDPSRGFRFPSYASYWIRAYILKFMLTNHHLVKIGTTQEQRRLFFNLTKTRTALEKGGEPATPEQLAEALKATPEEVIEMELRMSGSATSIDAPGHGGEDGLPAREFAASEEWRPDLKIEMRDSREFALAAVAAFGKTLDGRRRIIFEKRLIAENPVTLIDLAAEFGISRGRVRQIEQQVLERLKKYVDSRFGSAVLQ
jgi:RNA polymerase sigma-32 factor